MENCIKDMNEDTVSLNSSNCTTDCTTSTDFLHELSIEDGVENRKSVLKSSSDIVDALCVVGPLRENEELKKIIKDGGYAVLESEDGQAYKEDRDVAFVMREFSGADFNYLRSSSTVKIYGPTIITECLSSGNMNLPNLRKNRPLYCSSMKGVVACLSGFRNKQKITELVDLIHSMGGSVRKDFSCQSITHLITITTQTEKYRLSISMGKPTMSVNWVYKCWENRDVPLFSAISETMIEECKLMPFHALFLSFSHFPDEDLPELYERAEKHGAVVVEPPDAQTTHLVVDCRSPISKEILEPNERCKIVSAEWFWISLNWEVCANETLYPPAMGKAGKRPYYMPMEEYRMNNNRKSNKRSFYENRKSMDSLFDQSSDVTGIPDHIFSTEDIEAGMINSPKKAMSKRHQVCMELLQTEMNYVEVLRTIVMLFKKTLESNEKQYLTKAEHHLIFGKIPPIFEVHKAICHDLSTSIHHWTEQRCIGEAILKHADSLVRCYPNFVNNFDQAKETLEKAVARDAKFHVFLKGIESKAECQRQTLKELLIRPVQRLPSVVLLLNDILKQTDKAFNDHSLLQQAIEAIKNVLAHINENKRQTDDRVHLITIFQDIENCPVTLVSSHREFITSLNVCDLSGELKGKKGQEYTLFLFNDVLEVAKKRGEPVSTPRKSRHSLKHYKHRQDFVLTCVRLVYDIQPIDGVEGLFCLNMRDGLRGDTDYPLQVVPCTADLEKRDFLKTLCAQVGTISSTRNEFGVQEYEVETNQKPNLSELMKKSVKHLKPGSKKGNLSRNVSSSFVFAKPQSLRRAVSHAAMTWSGRMTGTLHRMSRTNLRNIFEEDTANSTMTSSSSLSKKKSGSKRKMGPSESFCESPAPRTPKEPQIEPVQSNLDIQEKTESEVS